MSVRAAAATHPARPTRTPAHSPNLTAHPAHPHPAHPVRPVRTPRRRGRGRIDIVHPPLGSLTQRDHRPGASCQACGSVHVTRLSMNLTDGTPVDFTSCHHCEHKTWEHPGGPLSVDGVLDRTRKP